MIVEPDFLDHWKTRLLARKLKTEAAPIYVIRLWAHCQTRKAWRFQGWDQDVLASVCRWEGDAGLFWSAMLETFCRLEDGHLVAHDWDGANASLIANWANGQRGGRPRRNPPKTHGLTQAKPMANPSLTHGVTDREDREDREEKMDKNTRLVAPSLELAAHPWSVDGVLLPEPMRTEPWQRAVTEWTAYKREKRQAYKPKGLGTAMGQWGRDFASAEDFASAVARSIANGWAGVFPAKPQTTSFPNRYGTATPADAEF